MKEKGAVTVFLSFTFLLVMSLILTLLEGARSRAAAAMADMQLTTCVESLLGEFYRPLYEKYCVFGIDTSFGGKTPDVEGLKEVMVGYGGDSSFGLNIEDCAITATRPFLTKDGKGFLNQVVEYEKYCAVVDTVGSLMERLGVLSKESGIYKIYERQMEIEDNLSLIDRNTLLLMEKTDGPVCSGFTVGEVREEFVKSFMTRGIDPVSVGINNPDIWELLKDKYFDPKPFAEKADQYFETALPIAENRDRIKEEIRLAVIDRDKLSEELRIKKVALSKILDEKEGGPDEEEEITEEEKTLKSETEKTEALLEELNGRISDLTDEKKKLNESINDLVGSAGALTDELVRRVSGCLHEAREAVALIEEDRSIVQRTRPMIDAFDTLIESSKSILSEEMYNSLKISLSKMKKFTGMDGSKPDFEIMESTLRTDVKVLSDIETDVFISSDIAKAILTEVSVGKIGEWSNRIGNVRKSINEYSYDSLVFDYSEMHPDKIICELADGVKRTVANGFLDLLIGPGKVSEKKITVRTRPSDLLDLKDVETVDAEGVLSGELGKESGAESFVKTDATKVTNAAASELEKGEIGIREKLLLILYIREHFGDYFDRVTSARSVLAYEQEYILCGNRSDAENLAEIASMIMLARMVTSGVYVMSDSALHAKALEIATSLVGFTGLHFLTLVVKYMIMFAWSTEQAIVETAAILAGKKVPILTSSSSYCIDTVDFSVITSDGIKDKVKNFRESEACLLYEDYICLFMLAIPCEKLCLRTMDMIEENMRWAYDGSFLLENCITGFDTTIVFSCPSRYIGIFDGLFADIQTPSGYGFVRQDSVNY